MLFFIHNQSPTLRSGNDAVNGLGNMLDIGALQTRDGRPSRVQQVDVELLHHASDLILVQPRVAKHAVLLDNVRPLARCLERNKLIVQALPHGLDAAAHDGKVVDPHGKQLRISKHLFGHRDTEARRHGEVGALQRDEMTLDDSRRRGDSGCARGEDVDGARPLAVETEVLGKGLADGELNGRARDKVPNSGGVLVQVARGKALVGHVEDDKEALVLAHRGNLPPLLEGGVRARRVVRAGLQEDGVALLRVLPQVVHHGGEVEAAQGRVEVGVELLAEAGRVVAPDLKVVGPRGIRQPHRRRLRVARRLEEPRDDAVGA